MNLNTKILSTADVVKGSVVITLIAMTAATVFAAPPASPYEQGTQTTDPNCVVNSANCTVVPPAELDWELADGTGGAYASAITDSIFTMGQVGIGVNTTDASLDITAAGNDETTTSIQVVSSDSDDHDLFTVLDNGWTSTYGSLFVSPARRDGIFGNDDMGALSFYNNNPIVPVNGLENVGVNFVSGTAAMKAKNAGAGNNDTALHFVIEREGNTDTFSNNHLIAGRVYGMMTANPNATGSPILVDFTFALKSNGTGSAPGDIAPGNYDLEGVPAELDVTPYVTVSGKDALKIVRSGTPVDPSMGNTYLFMDLWAHNGAVTQVSAESTSNLGASL